MKKKILILSSDNYIRSNLFNDHLKKKYSLQFFNYSGSKIGPKWKPGFTKAIKYWVPSIAVSAMTIYKGKTFEEWNGDALITSLKDQSLRRVKFKNNNFESEEIIFKGKIGRIRDIKIQDNTGDLFMISDNGSLWRMYK